MITAGKTEKITGLSLKLALPLAIAVVLGALLFWNPNSQSSSWIYPFFSGAANLGFDLQWRVDSAAYPAFAALPYAEQLAKYHFAAGNPADLAPYDILDRGYVFVVWLAQKALFWMPQIKAVIWLQIAFHTASSLFVLGRLDSGPKRLAFILFYALNPLVLHFVTFAYLYYWQVLPAFAWFIWETKRGKATISGLILLALVLVGAYFIRQSTMMASALILALAAWQLRTFLGLLVLVAFIGLTVAAKNPSEPWHTAYVGIGAYSNADHIKLDDESGYKVFLDETGIAINTAPPKGNYYDPVIRQAYYGVMKDAFMTYAKAHPFEMLRNAGLNTLQGFSVGYFVGSLAQSLINAALGLVMLGLMLYRRLYGLIAIMFFSIAGFVAYFPPIPAYMFGNFPLIALAAGYILEWIVQSVWFTGVVSRVQARRTGSV